MADSPGPAAPAPLDQLLLRKAFAKWCDARREAEEMREARIIADAQAGIPVGATPTSPAEKALWLAEGLAHGEFFHLLTIADTAVQAKLPREPSGEARAAARAAWGFCERCEDCLDKALAAAFRVDALSGANEETIKTSSEPIDRATVETLKKFQRGANPQEKP